MKVLRTPTSAWYKARIQDLLDIFVITHGETLTHRDKVTSQGHKIC